jgi:hypothetical protein
MTGLMQIGGRLGSLGRLATYATETPAPDADNFATFRNVSGSTVTDYPLRFGRVFAEGEIADAPEVLLDDTPIDTQADVKTRWGDDSVKHCIISCIVPSAANNTDIEITFQNQASPDNTALTKAEMLNARFDFDAVLSITVSAVAHTASARDMLTADDYTVWCSGPIATTIILADHSATAAYDLEWAAGIPIRPIVYATFWNDLDKVEIDVVAEQSDPEHLGDVTGDIAITTGDASPSSVFTKSAHVMRMATSWIKHFWLGGAPETDINLDHNLSYLISTFAFPNWNTALVVPGATITSHYSAWTSAAKNIGDVGRWTKTMPNTGGRNDLGPVPTWDVLWLYTGDYRMREQSLGQADLAANWATRLRETVATKGLLRGDEGTGTGMGLPVSLTERKTTSLAVSWAQGTAGDKFKVIGSNDTDWQFDGAHQPNAFATSYALTGHHYYLEQQQFWACVYAHHGNGEATAADWGRGPTGAEGGNTFEQPRGFGRPLVVRCNAAYWSPDADPMKEYLEVLVDDALAVFEGRWNITTGTYNSNTMWDWSYDVSPYSELTNPLHIAEKNAGTGTGWFIPPAGGGTSSWMHYVFLYAAAIAVELGFPATALRDWLSVYLIGQATDPDFNPFIICAYQQPTAPSGNATVLQTWEDVFDLCPSEEQTRTTLVTLGGSTITDLNHEYGLIAAGASTFMDSGLPGYAAALSFLQTEGFDICVDPETNPQWQFLPRT